MSIHHKCMFILLSIIFIVNTTHAGEEYPCIINVPVFRYQVSGSGGWLFSKNGIITAPDNLIDPKTKETESDLEEWLDNEVDLYFLGKWRGLRLGRRGRALNLGFGVLADYSGENLRDIWNANKKPTEYVLRMGRLRLGNRFLLQVSPGRLYIMRVINISRDNISMQIVKPDEETEIWVSGEEWREPKIDPPPPKPQLTKEMEARKCIHRLSDKKELTKEEAQQAIIEMVDKGLPIMSRVESEYYPLKTAAAKGNAILVIVLIEAGHGADFREKGKSTALHSAAALGHLEVCKILIENGAKVDVIDSFNTTPLELARERGQKDIIKYFLSLKDIGTRNILSSGNIELIKKYLNENEDISKKDLQWAIHQAVDNGDDETFKLLLTKDLDPFNKSYHGSGSAFERVVKNNNLAMVKLCMEGKDKEELAKYSRALFNARTKEMVDLLVTAGLNPGFKSAEDSPLLQVAQMGTVEMLRAHESAGNIMPLWSWIRVGQVDAIEKRFNENTDKLKNDLKNVDNIGRNALHYAAKQGLTDIAKEINKIKVIGIMDVDNIGRTPMHYASESKRVEFMTWLLSLDHVNVNVQDKNGITPLILAVRANSTEIVKLLLDHGADRTLVPKTVKSILDYTNPRSKVYKLLK